MDGTAKASASVVYISVREHIVYTRIGVGLLYPYANGLAKA